MKIKACCVAISITSTDGALNIFQNSDKLQIKDIIQAIIYQVEIHV